METKTKPKRKKKHLKMEPKRNDNVIFENWTEKVTETKRSQIVIL